VHPVKQHPVRWTQPGGTAFALDIAFGIAALIVRPFVGQQEAEFFGAALLVSLSVAIGLCAIGYLLDWLMRRQRE
jgi:hypothetical protein